MKALSEIARFIVEALDIYARHLDSILDALDEGENPQLYAFLDNLHNISNRGSVNAQQVQHVASSTGADLPSIIAQLEQKQAQNPMYAYKAVIASLKQMATQ